MVSTVTKLSSGDDMPIIGLGTWKSKPGEVAAAVKYALQIGYRHLDCAFVYGNEHEVGQGIKEAMEEHNIARKEIWVTSKLWSSFHHPEEVEAACKQSLKNLSLDYLDLYLIHWPTAFKRGEGNFPKNEDGTIKVYSGNKYLCVMIKYCIKMISEVLI
jgi:diketogulonate reductase-like aldo/keto reductase